MSEALTQRAIMLAVSEVGSRAWRNSVGLFYTADGRPVRCGLTPGSSDLIGFVPVRITEQHVGQTLAVFLALEVKSARGRSTQEQRAFIALVRRMGGRAGIARSEADAMAILDGKG